jgi:hypothetical protein
VGAGLVARERAVGIGRRLESDDDERDSDYELRWCRRTTGCTELNTKVAVSAVVDLAVGAVKMRPVHRHGEQQRRYRKERNELACTHVTQAIEHF